MFKFFNKNLNNKFIKGNLGLNKVKYEKELLEKTLLKYTSQNVQIKETVHTTYALRHKTLNFAEQKKNFSKKK